MLTNIIQILCFQWNPKRFKKKLPRKENKKKRRRKKTIIFFFWLEMKILNNFHFILFYFILNLHPKFPILSVFLMIPLTECQLVLLQMLPRPYVNLMIIFITAILVSNLLEHIGTELIYFNLLSPLD